jgi:hypothetical protein
MTIANTIMKIIIRTYFIQMYLIMGPNTWNLNQTKRYEGLSLSRVIASIIPVQTVE